MNIEDQMSSTVLGVDGYINPNVDVSKEFSNAIRNIFTQDKTIIIIQLDAEELYALIKNQAIKTAYYNGWDGELPAINTYGRQRWWEYLTDESRELLIQIEAVKNE